MLYTYTFQKPYLNEKCENRLIKFYALEILSLPFQVPTYFSTFTYSSDIGHLKLFHGIVIFFLQSVPHLENLSVTHLMWAWNLSRWHLSYLALCFAEPIVFFCVSLLFSYVGPTVRSGVRHRFRVRYPACFDCFLLHFFRQFQKKKHKEQNTLQMTCIFSLWLYFES